MMASDLLEDGVVLAIFAERVTFLAQVIKGDEGKRNVTEIVTKGRASQLCHHFFLAASRGH